jgi:hypothetical protein
MIRPSPIPMSPGHWVRVFTEKGCRKAEVWWIDADALARTEDAIPSGGRWIGPVEFNDNRKEQPE